jgi:NADPH2:quinone reductase
VVLYTQNGFADEVNKLTEGKGADLVIDTVGPDVFKESIIATAHFGRLITLLDPGELSLAEARMRNLLIGFELMLTPVLRNLPEQRDKHMDILNQCSEWFDQGLIKTHISEQLPLADAVKAHQMIEAGHTAGKIVLAV